MASLLIDLGNSRLKWGLERDGRLEVGDEIEYQHGDWDSALAPAFTELGTPDKVIIGSVAGAEANAGLEKWLQDRWAAPVLFVKSPELGHGVANAYQDPAALGIDRWAAMVGAYHKLRTAVCVVDCGTAVTVDVIDHKGKHLGGAIVPGLTLMYTALAQRTHALPPGGESPMLLDSRLGVDTVGCVSAGGVHAVAGMIERIVQQMNRRLKTSIDCVITGGDARKIMPHLNVRMQFEPHLVLQGLALIARGR
jgi:type III pantothenate kinase